MSPAHAQTRGTLPRWAGTVVLVLAFGLRVPLLNGPRFHPDEALFASFARSIAVWRDPLLATAPVDKPPLLFYLQALCYPFLGPREMAARLPNLWASLVTVAITYAIARQLGRVAPTANDVRARAQCLGPTVAALIVALSPLAIAFGATAFTDPLMVMWGTAAVLAAVGGRPGWSGFWLGLGVATKYQAILFLPLAAGILWLRRDGDGARRWIRLLGGVAGPLVAVAIWDLARDGRLSLLSAQLGGYGGVQVAALGEWWPRLRAWARLWPTMLGSPVLNAIVVTALFGLLFLSLLRRPPLGHSTCTVKIERLSLVWLAGYLLAHWILEVNIWDRYLLPVVPVLGAILGSRCGLIPNPDLLGQWNRRIARAAPGLVLVVILLLMAPAAVQASSGSLPLGGDHGAMQGIEQAAEFFASYPYGTVLYDHWLGWELRYYLFDSRVYVSWFGNPDALVENLSVFGADPPRYLIIPTWELATPVIRPVEAAGLTVTMAFEAFRPDGTPSFQVFRITGATHPNQPGDSE